MTPGGKPDSIISVGDISVAFATGSVTIQSALVRPIPRARVRPVCARRAPNRERSVEIIYG